LKIEPLPNGTDNLQCSILDDQFSFLDETMVLKKEKRHKFFRETKGKQHLKKIRI